MIGLGNMGTPKIERSSEARNYGKFVISPLERGYGTTMGNSLRRVLLSSIEGVAVTSIRIADVQPVLLHGHRPFVGYDVEPQDILVAACGFGRHDADSIPARDPTGAVRHPVLHDDVLAASVDANAVGAGTLDDIADDQIAV